MSIPFLDLSTQHQELAEDIHRALGQILAHGGFINGPEVASFETDFARYCHASHCIGVANGTDALHIALRACGVGPGDEVLVPAMSFAATAEAVVLAGATPVFVDCHPQTHTLDPNLVAPRITALTKAVIPVHLYGQAADLPRLAAIAKEQRLHLIQDCAQAHGATCGGRPLADFGGTLCFSFFPGKVLGALGDAGAIVTNDPDAARWMRMFANHGRVDKYDHQFSGTNSRLDSIQAAVLALKLRRLDQWLAARRRVAASYSTRLAGLPGLSLPLYQPGDHALHLYVVRHPRRDALQRHLRGLGIATGVHYPIAIPFLVAFAPYAAQEDFPEAKRLQQQCLSLPIYPEIPEDHVVQVAQAVADFCHAPEQA